ncbi:MAG TPA: cytochrome C oxidase subunit II [Polyangia bacterium]|nr:cytochrome C oxidase subunit II [Polyangia bacterium]
MTAILALALGAPPKPETGFGMPHDASIDGHLIDWLINVTSGFVIILFVIMCVWMLYAALKHGRDHQAEYDHGSSKHSVTVALVISAIIFFVVDGNLFVNSMVDLSKAFWNHADAEAMGSVVRIEVNAHQWAWDARYAGADGQFGTADDVVTLNDIRVPAETPILIQLASVDVIHSFYLPNFRVKQDAMPGMVNRMWFRAKPEEIGNSFDIACAQHCGTNHYKMKGTLTVLSKEDYAKWLQDQAAVSTRAYDPNDQEAHWGWKWKEI